MTKGRGEEIPRVLARLLGVSLDDSWSRTGSLVGLLGWLFVPQALFVGDSLWRSLG